MLRKFSAIFFSPFSLLSPYGTAIMWILVPFKLSQSSLRLSSFLFLLFSLSCLSVISTSLSSTSPIHSYASYILLLVPSSEFFYFGYCILHLWLIFTSSISLLNIFCKLLIFASNFPLRSWIILTIITLKSFSWRLLISSSLSCFLGFSFFLFLHLTHLSLSFHLYSFSCGLLFAGKRVVASLASGAFPLVGEVDIEACCRFLGERGLCLTTDRWSSHWYSFCLQCPAPTVRHSCP